MNKPSISEILTLILIIAASVGTSVFSVSYIHTLRVATPTVQVVQREPMILGAYVEKQTAIEEPLAGSPPGDAVTAGVQTALVPGQVNNLFQHYCQRKPQSAELEYWTDRGSVDLVSTLEDNCAIN